MKVLSRDFTLKEKILLLILCLILLAFTYYQFVDRPVRLAISNAEAERAALEDELVAVQLKLGKLRNMQEEMDSIAADEKVSVMGSYNNSKAEIDMLNDVLEAADRYSISFSNVTRTGDQIRRNFSLQFSTNDYDMVTKILTELVSGENRCLLSDIRCSSDGNVLDGKISVSVTATFYETMVGGTPDSGLPKDSAAG